MNAKFKDLKIETDVCNNEFSSITLPLKPDWQGQVVATLVFKINPENLNRKAVLYLHGFIDYFFNWELAAFYNDLGFDFFALDLRKYGRSLLDHQTPNIIGDMEDYYEELDLATDIIKEKFGFNSIVLMGHSTGGLLAAIYAQDRPGLFQALVLNSAFFQFNVPPLKRKLLIPIIKVLNKFVPQLGMNSLTEVYPKSLHKDYFGEWDFNLNWKPISNFPAHIMWLNAIQNAQNRIHNGLHINIPILSLFSDKSFQKSTYNPDAQLSDSVLDIVHINKYSSRLGPETTKIVIDQALHDIFLSSVEVRRKAYASLKAWLESLTN